MCDWDLCLGFSVHASEMGLMGASSRSRWECQALSARCTDVACDVTIASQSCLALCKPWGDVCSGFAGMQVDAFRADADRALGESDQVFKQRVARAPVPTSA